MTTDQLIEKLVDLCNNKGDRFFEIIFIYVEIPKWSVCMYLEKGHPLAMSHPNTVVVKSDTLNDALSRLVAMMETAEKS